jgi:hypothetical protein
MVLVVLSTFLCHVGLLSACWGVGTFAFLGGTRLSQDSNPCKRTVSTRKPVRLGERVGGAHQNTSTTPRQPHTSSDVAGVCRVSNGMLVSGGLPRSRDHGPIEYASTLTLPHLHAGVLEYTPVLNTQYTRSQTDQHDTLID